MGYLKGAKTHGVSRGTLEKYVKQYEGGEVNAVGQNKLFQLN
jgi:hypothetical protein